MTGIEYTDMMNASISVLSNGAHMYSMMSWHGSPLVLPNEMMYNNATESNRLTCAPLACHPERERRNSRDGRNSSLTLRMTGLGSE